MGHYISTYENNRAEKSHESTRVREQGMCGAAFRRFKSVRQAQRFLGAHAAVSVPISGRMVQILDRA